MAGRSGSLAGSQTIGVDAVEDAEVAAGPKGRSTPSSPAPDPAVSVSRAYVGTDRRDDSR